MITALIVDDEKHNRSSLEKQLNDYCPDVKVVGVAGSVPEAVMLAKSKNPDVVFLDVEMPGGSGFDLLREMDPVSFRVIFVTAHSNYAIKAIRFSALDYLLKPVDTDDLVAAVRKISNEPNPSGTSQYRSLLENLETGKPRKLAIPVKDGFAFLSPAEIIRLQADGTYTHIYTAGGKYTGSKNIKEYEQLLSDFTFFRSHNSHLINLEHVKRFSRLDGYFVHMSDGSQAEISRRKKEEFIERMSGRQA
ncbi:MAG: response regulator transcription factor [Bacteroidia bacterium]|nr:response regulator transcription factor [Bacteroidia bacterium]